MWFKGGPASQLLLPEMGNVGLPLLYISFAPKGTLNIEIYVKYLGFQPLELK